MHRTSIITATLNRPSLQVACESVERQIDTDWHHYVIGDGLLPTEYEHPQRTTIGFTRPVGAFEPAADKPDGTPNPILRWAIEHLAIGTYVCFLDDDNAYKPEFLSTMLQALEQNQLGVAICALEDCRNDNLHDGYPELGRCDNSGFLARTNAAKDIGYDHARSDRDNIEDFDFISGMAEKYGWIRVPKKLVFFGLHPATLPVDDRSRSYAAGRRPQPAGAAGQMSATESS
jgi:hypothetical protein